MTFMSRKLLSGILLAAMASAPLTGPAQAESVTLRYSQWLPATYPLQAEIIDPWFEEIARVTEGRVTIVATPKVVGTVAGQYDVLVDGLADVALVVPGYTPGRFPLTEGWSFRSWAMIRASRCRSAIAPMKPIWSRRACSRKSCRWPCSPATRPISRCGRAK